MNDFDFCKAPWHDAEILAIHIDRSEPGARDEIRVSVVWPDRSSTVIYFHDCYGFECSMNFGVVARETIRDASLSTTGTQLDDLRRTWENAGVSLSDVNEYRIVTNSTASVLVIFARSVSTSPVSASWTA